MPRRYRPPSGYRQEEFPQLHNYSFGFSLSLDDETLNSTIIPIVNHDEEIYGSGAPTRDVNPAHDGFLVADNHGALRGSIINNIRFSFMARMAPDLFIVDGIQNVSFDFMPIYCSFKEDYDALDDKSTETVASILELQTTATDQQGRPLYVAGTDLLGPSGAGSDLHSAYSDILDTDLGIESVAFNKSTFYNAMKYFMNRGKLMNCVGKMFHVTLNRNKPFRYSTKGFVNAKVKRSNPYMFCGYLFHCSLAGSQDQIPEAAEVTADANKEHIWIKGNSSFEEWHKSFNMDADTS